MSDREELQALRRMAELEARAGGQQADFSGVTTKIDTTAAKPGDAKPSLFRNDSDFYREAGISRFSPRMAWAATKDMFGARSGAADYIAEQVGGEAVQDDRGEPAVKLPNGGSTYRMNDPGLDSTDVANFLGNVGAYFIPAGIVARANQAKNAGLGARALTQGVTAGATDAALQLGTTGTEHYSPGRTAAAVAGGAGGEAIGTFIGSGLNRLVGANRRLTGASQREAADLANRAGISEPTTNQFARLTQGADEIAAGANPNAIIGQNRFGFQYTLGQRTADPNRQIPLLNREELLRQRPGSQEVFASANRHNQEQLGTAVSDIGERLGGRPGATPAELAQGAAGRVQQQADELGQRITDAYEAASRGGRTAVGVDAVSELPNRLRRALDDLQPDPDLHPVTSKTLQQINTATEFAKRGGVKGVTLKAIEQRRKIINTNMDAVGGNAADRRAMTMLKREFDSWLDDAVDSALVSGDPQALAALKDARALRFEFGRRFEGGTEADKFIAGMLDGSRTPEELINIALGASGVSKAGGARFIQRLKVATGNDPEVIGNLRAAHFQRIAMGKNGEPLQMGQIVRNIKSTEYSNASIMNALYSPDEWRQIRLLADSLEPLIAKGDYAKSSGTTERLMRMLGGRLGPKIPFIGGMIEGVGAGMNWRAASNSLNKPMRLPGRSPPGFTPTATAVMDELAR